MNLQFVKRLMLGVAAATFLPMMAWFYLISIQASIPVIPGIVATSLWAISFGILATFASADDFQEQTNIKFARRFIFGMTFGVFIAMNTWFYSVFCNVSIPLVQEITGTLFLAVSCGIVASFGSMKKLMDNPPI